MNDLPNELLILIFENLEIGHLIQCRLVCKRFMLLCQEVKIPELIISNTTENLKDRDWFFTNKQLNYQNAISATSINSHRLTFRLDKSRRLYFYGNTTEYAQLKLNEFTRLEQVAINLSITDADDVRQEFHINLPNLRMLEIHSRLRRYKFFITTPKLEVLKYDEFDSLDLTYADNIKHLETEFYTESLHILNDDDIPLIKHVRDFKLTTLTCNGNIDSVREAIKKLIQDKRKHRRSFPKIYFLSVEVDDVKKIEEYENHPDDFLFQINNYDSLAETIFKDTWLQHYSIYYNELMNTMQGKIPEDFFKKFSSTRYVGVNGKVENPEHLLWFLKNFDSLQELNLESDPLDQSFYSQLGDFDQLCQLVLLDSSVNFFASSKLTLNFDFILKLKKLRLFHTNFRCPNILDLALELFTHSKHFSSIIFHFKGKKGLISMNCNAFNLYYDGYSKFMFGINELPHEVDAIRSRPRRKLHKKRRNATKR